MAARIPFFGLRMPVETWPILGIMAFVPPLISFFSVKVWAIPRASELSNGNYRMSNTEYIENVIGDRSLYHRLQE